jgi:hypothetical protein
MRPYRLLVRSLLVCAAASCWSAPALAITEPTSGVWLDVGGGSGFGGTPAATPGGIVSIGGFHGRYDHEYALGRYWAWGATWRPGYAGGLQQDVLFEVRRGVDIIVAAPFFGLAGGVGLGAATTGVAEATGGVKWRWQRTIGLSLRVGAGARFGGATAVLPSASAHLAFSYSAPIRKADPEP